MTLQETLTRDANRFLREEVNPRRDAADARRFRAESAQVTESTVVIPLKKIEPARPKIEETLFTPNSNAQGI
jgi:hypothetical protein